MPFSGAGTFSPYTPGNPVVTGTAISSVAFNNTITDIATGLSNTITRDGQSPATANIPMASHKITGLSAGSVAGDSVRYEQLPSASNLVSVAFGGTGSATAGAALTALGAAASGANNDITSLASPAIAGATATTQAAGDNSTKVATTAWAKAYGGLIGSQSPTAYSASGTVTSTDLGKPTYANVATPITLTLPVGAAGNVFVFSSLGTGLVTLARSGTQLFYAQGIPAATSLLVGTGDTVCLVSDGGNWIQVLGSSQLGVGQTWQVRAGAAFATTYTNSTGKPITVSVYNTSAAGGNNWWTATVGGVASVISCSSAAAAAPISITFIVPVGATYSLANTSGTTAIGSWYELK
jgi:hypothetical protein